MQSHYIKEYLLKAAIEKAGIKSINTPYADAKFLANSIAENLGEAGRISDRTLVRCFEDKEKWTDTWGYLAAYVMDKGDDFQQLQPTDKAGRQLLLRNCLKEYRTELENQTQASIPASNASSENTLLENTTPSTTRRSFLKNSLYAGLGAIGGISLFSAYQQFTKNGVLPPLNMLVNTHPGNELYWQYIDKWANQLKTHSNGRIDIRPRLLNEVEKERKESLLQRLILGKDFEEGAFDLYCSVSYHDESDNSALNFYGTIPFGMTSQEFDAWYAQEGKRLLNDYKDAYKVYLLGNTGEQVGGWFLKPLDRVEDLENRVVRMHGLGANVLQRSANNVRVFRTFLDAKGFVERIKVENGDPSLYAIEYMNAHSDKLLNYHQLLEVLSQEGFDHSTLVLYEKGWHERGTTWTIKMNRGIYELLQADKELLAIFESTTQVLHHEITQVFEQTSRTAMRQWKQQQDELPFQIKKFNRPVGQHLLEKTAMVLNEKYAGNKIYQSYATFHKNWSGIDLQKGEILDDLIWDELFEAKNL